VERGSSPVCTPVSHTSWAGSTRISSSSWQPQFRTERLNQCQNDGSPV
jgi:hypothetical protein